MRLIFLSPALLLFPAALALAGWRSHTNPSTLASSPTLIQTIDTAFFRTQNLRGGEGRLAPGSARRPGVPAVFHASAHGPGAILVSLAHDEALGLWAVPEGDAIDPLVPSGSVYYADRAMTRPAGHFLVASSGDGLPSLTKTDVRYDAGPLQGTAYKSDLTFAEDGSGALKAAGVHPSLGSYSMVGRWSKANVGEWSQRWEIGQGGWERDAYRNRADGTSLLKVTTGEGTILELRFAVDHSGEGTVADACGRTARLTWNAEGDGAVVWTDGSTTAFEDWTVSSR